MDELLQKLLEAEVLSEDTKKELEEAMKSKLDEAIELVKTETAADVRAELTEQWIQERDALIEAVDSKVTEFLKIEMDELKDDIERFRDLEAEFAEKLVEAKSQMSDELKGDLAELVEKLDAFLEIRLTAEMEELHEDLEEVKKNDFGRRMFEAVQEEYRMNFADDDSIEANLRETEENLEAVTADLEESVRKLSDMERNEKMGEVLSTLDGRSKDVMEAILRNVPTDQLDEGYKTFIGRVLKETAEDTNSEKEDKVLAEGKENGEDKTVVEGDVVTGDNEALITERKEDSADSETLTEDARRRLQVLAGIID